MTLDKQAIDEFKQIWKKEFGEEISNERAMEEGSKLIRLFKVIYKPIIKIKK